MSGDSGRSSDSSALSDFDPARPPPLNYTIKSNRREFAIGVFFGLIFVEAGVLPLILFYSIRWGAHVSITTNLAIITSLVGTYSSYKLARRSWYLFIKDGSHQRRPLGASRFGPDAFTYVSFLLFDPIRPSKPAYSWKDTNWPRDDRLLYASRHWLVSVGPHFLPFRFVLTRAPPPGTQARSTPSRCRCPAS